MPAFYWTYVAFMVPVGWATERFGAHRVLAAGAALWALATLFTGFAGGVVGLVVLRLLLATGNYTLTFAVAGLVNVLGIIGWGFILPKLEPIDWTARRRPA